MKNRLLLFFITLLVACTTNQPTKGTAIDEMNVELRQGIAGNKALAEQSKQPMPRDVSKALVPDMKIRSPYKKQIQRRFDISVKDVPARQFFTGLVADTPLSIAVSPEVKGNITLDLKHVTVEQVLQTLENVYGYAYNPIPGGYEVLPNTLKTQIYSVNYLELERKGRSNMKLSSGEVTQEASGSRSRTTGGTTTTSTSGSGGVNSFENVIGDVQTQSTVNFWKQLKESLESIIGQEEGRSVTVNPTAGVVVVRAMPKELKQIETYLDIVQNSMDRQVILEAKILEVTLNNEYQMGIDWKIFGARLNALTDFPGTNISQSQFPDAFRIDIKWNDSFETTIQALETQGNIQVLSSPRVSTMNNQKSAIKVGSDEFFVTNVSSNTNFATAAGVATAPTQNVDLTPFFSGITLDVTPQIDAKDNVTLHIHPSVSEVRDQRKRIDLGANTGVLELPLAQSTIRESDTIVHAHNGQVVVIGGLMQNQTEEDIAELPFFGNIPFLGTLFRATRQSSRKSELVILLKPTIVNNKSSNKHLIESTQKVMRLKRGFHIGGRPDIFGTEGEEPISFGPKAGYYGR